VSLNKMSLWSKIFFYFQYTMGRITIFITVPLVFFAFKIVGYRVNDLQAIRQKVKNMMRDHTGPWLICANHLTLIDSVILAYAMMPGYKYILNYRLLPWNVPEKMNFNRNFLVGLACFLTKCIPITRGGDRDDIKSTMAKCTYLLNKKENLMIFPEGTRSRLGRVNTEEHPYGVGRFICHLPDCRVMCIYLRGKGQKTFSNFPKFGETFTMVVEECHPKSQLKGLRAQKDCSEQVIRHLSKMETVYFESCG
jgi:1-acyl-sn-glycerol-3-phosphate acyltransferase